MDMGVSENGRMKELSKPIEFIVPIAGELEKATLHAIGNDDTDIIYRISFTNGYTDHFHFNEQGFHGELPGSRHYLEAILPDLQAIQFYEPGKLLYNFRYRAKGEVNVWIQESHIDDQPVYAVYYQGACQFWIDYELDRWKVILPANIESVDKELVRKVELLLNKLT
jgi:hypothetical protein